MPIFTDEKTGTTVLRFGVGDIGVFTLDIDNAEPRSAFAVGFRQDAESHEIGQRDPSVIGKSAEEVGELVRMEFTDPRSIDVVIEHLEEVKANWGWE